MADECDGEESKGDGRLGPKTEDGRIETGNRERSSGLSSRSKLYSTLSQTDLLMGHLGNRRRLWFVFVINLIGGWGDEYVSLLLTGLRLVYS